MRALLDTSLLIGDQPPPDVEAAISVASLAELHFGVLLAADDDERAVRIQRLGATESTFEALPITADIAREWGRLAAAVRNRGGQPRRRAMDLVIAATANVHGVPLLTHNGADFKLINDLTDARSPSTPQATTTEPDDGAVAGAVARGRVIRASSPPCPGRQHLRAVAGDYQDHPRPGSR